MAQARNNRLSSLLLGTLTLACATNACVTNSEPPLSKKGLALSSLITAEGAVAEFAEACGRLRDRLDTGDLDLSESAPLEVLFHEFCAPYETPLTGWEECFGTRSGYFSEYRPPAACITHALPYLQCVAKEVPGDCQSTPEITDCLRGTRGQDILPLFGADVCGSFSLSVDIDPRHSSEGVRSVGALMPCELMNQRFEVRCHLPSESCGAVCDCEGPQGTTSVTLPSVHSDEDVYSAWDACGF